MSASGKTPTPALGQNGKRFRIAFSFAGEQRAFVAQVAALLAARFGEGKILYDKYHKAEFSRDDLAFYLPKLYRNETDLIVAVFCPDYPKREWCGLEWKAIFDLLKKHQHEQVMLTRFGHVEGEGLYSLAGYTDLHHESPESAATLILERLALNEGKTKGHYLAAINEDKSRPSTSTPNNLPRLNVFFGRTAELQQIADALHPDARTWGALIDGPGGMGKTSLAIRAAELVPPGQFQRIIFLSAKEREMTADGQHSLSGFVLPSYVQMLKEMAEQIGRPEVAQFAEEERPRRLKDALHSENALLIFDNLESLSPEHREQVFVFLGRLPRGCKAIVTSRRRTDLDARTIRLHKLDQDAAHRFIEELAAGRPLLASAAWSQRQSLYEETGGNPLLLRWVAGQLGNGRCRTIADTLAFLRSAPANNDPLEFIFGDLIGTFSVNETKVLAALTHFTRLVETKFIADLAGLTKTAAEVALNDLANRALVVPDDTEQNYSLVPMVADFLRNKNPQAVRASSDWLANHAYVLIVENGGEKHDCFPVLEAAWPKLEAALPLFLNGENGQMQTVCASLSRFLEFTGRGDELGFLFEKAENKAADAGDFKNAGRRAWQAGWIFYRRKQAVEVQSCADRALAHWGKDRTTTEYDLACAQRMRGLGLRLSKIHDAAFAHFERALKVFKALSPESVDVAMVLNDIATVKRHQGFLNEAREYLTQALEVARKNHHEESVASYLSGFARLELACGNWKAAEIRARESLPLSRQVHREELVARACHRLAVSLAKQQRLSEGRPFAEEAIQIYTKLPSPSLPKVKETLADYCL